MVKVLIYSSKEIYDNAPFEGRAEAHIVAYRKDDGFYEIVKNRTNHYISPYSECYTIARDIRRIEDEEWEQEIRDYKLCQEMKNHPYIELSKNAEVAQR